MLKRGKKELGWDKRRREKSFIAKRTQRNKDRIDIDPHLGLQYVFSGMSKVGVKQSYRGILFHHGLTQLDFIKAIARTLAIECSDTQRLPSA